MTLSKKNKKDIDPQETQDWIDSIQSLISNFGIERAHFILDKIISTSRTNGLKLPFSAHTDYINTIPIANQKPYPGDREIESRIISSNLRKNYSCSQHVVADLLKKLQLKK